MKTQSLRSLVREITYKPKQRVATFTELSPEQKTTVLLRLSKYIQSQLLSQLKKEEIIPILERLDPDDVTDVLQAVPSRRQKELLTELSEELQKKVSMLLAFDPKTAAGLMSLNYIQVDVTDRLSEVAQQMQTHEQRTGKLPEVLVLEGGKLVGFLPIKQLIFASPGDRARDLLKKINIIRHTANFDSVVDHFIEHPHQKVAVLDENDTILGVIYSDDILQYVEENETSSLYDFAGVSNEETIFGSVKQKVKHRSRWLLINLATAFLASSVVSLFSDTISRYVILAAYMPIVAGMGGNAGTQTLAVLVRGIALRQIDLGTAWPTLRKELEAALIHGLLIGVVVATVVIIFNRNYLVALVLGCAMVVNLLVASFFGTLVPLIMAKLKKDPASSATVFITTATDVLGFLAFLGLASILLK